MRRTSVLRSKTLAQAEFTSAEHGEMEGFPRNGTFRGTCGIGIEKYSDIKEGNIIEAFVMEQIEV